MLLCLIIRTTLQSSGLTSHFAYLAAWLSRKVLSTEVRAMGSWPHIWGLSDLMCEAVVQIPGAEQGGPQARVYEVLLGTAFFAHTDPQQKDT